MPRAARTCNRCPAVITTGSRCTACARTADKIRGTATERGYNSPGHKAFRAAVLARDPICVLCRKAWANTADHHPMSRRELLDAHLDPDDPACGRGLCTSCHSQETTRHQPGGYQTQP